MNSTGTFGDTSGRRPSNTIAAVFATVHDARESIKALHKAGFKQTWLGVTKPAVDGSGEPEIEQSGMSRFFALDANLSLHQALLQHGLDDGAARRIEEDIAPGCAVVTVYGEDNPDRAVELLDEHQGDVVNDASAVPGAVQKASTSPRTGVDHEERKAADRERDPDRRQAGDAREMRDTRDPRATQQTIAGDDYFDDGVVFTESRYVRRDDPARR